MNYLYTWGSNLFGEIGNNTRDVISGYSNPVYIDSGASEWKQIGPGVFMVSAIKNDGSLWTWGRNVFGQLGVNSVIDMSSPVQEITLSTDWLQTSCSGEGTGAIKTDGTLWLWGHNYGGQLAQNLDFVSLNGLSSPSQIYGGGTNWSQLSFGLGYNVGALKADGTLWCWGNNYFGQCGVNSDSNSFSSPVQEITGSTNWAYLSLGAYFTAALKNDGTIWCWGQNYAGNLGDNTAIDKSSPVQEYTASTWLSVSAGVNYVLAIKNNNTLWTWGANYDGQLGLNSDTAIPVSVPTQIGAESTWVYASAGNSTALAIKSDGSLWSWGYNQNGELGQNTSINPSSSPVQVAIFNNFWTWAGGESAGIRNAPIPTPSPT
jgi:alpha-tubulin suppressor-like RCC1 family protein